MSHSHVGGPQPSSPTGNGNPKPPKPLRNKANLNARIIRQKVWNPPNLNDDWCCFVFVGREGSGKSQTCAAVLGMADPTFTAERVHFDPGSFLEQVQEWSPEERTGKAVMLDESGVGMGVRSWYDEEQIKLNQLMQTARDDNMIVGLTLPRLSELDSQFRGRLHGFCEMRELEKGSHAIFSWKNVDPSRDERDKLYKKYPRVTLGDREERVRRLAIGPPGPGFIEAYEQRKEEFKRELYEEVSESINEQDSSDDIGPKEIARDILDDDRLEEFIGDNHGQRYIDRDQIELEYDIGGRKSKKVKKAIQNDPEVEDDFM